MAKQVAEVVQAFIEVILVKKLPLLCVYLLPMQERGPGGPNTLIGPRFGGQGGFELENLYLIAVEHVTTGSLQPRIGYLHIPEIPLPPQYPNALVPAPM